MISSAIQLKKFNNKRANNPIDKWAIELIRHLSNEEVQIANKYMTKMFNLFIPQGNTNQNYTEIPSHPRQNDHHQENKNKCW
jgi:hypothetical protein